MTDMLPPSETDNYGGLNSADADWADPKTTSLMRVLALVILPLIFLMLVLFGLYLGWKKYVVASPAQTAAVSAPVSDKDAQIARLQAQVSALDAQLAHPAVAAAPAPAAATPAPPVYSADPGALARLSARIDRIEANQRAIAQAAVSANAATALQEAAKGPSPFLSELANVQTTLNAPNLTGPLQPYAEHGVPTATSLAVAFPVIAAHANTAAKAATGNDSLLNRLKHALGSLINIRRVDNVDGQGTEAILNRAEARLNAGDLKTAVATLDTLPAPAQRVMASWLADAHGRVVVDDTTAQITATALNHLSQINFDTSQDLPAQTTASTTPGAVL